MSFCGKLGRVDELLDAFIQQWEKALFCKAYLRLRVYTVSLLSYQKLICYFVIVQDVKGSIKEATVKERVAKTDRRPRPN